MRRTPCLLPAAVFLPAAALPFTAALLIALSLGGCRVDTHKNGKNDDVNIGTPFGSVHVKTDNAAALHGLGLTPYPGAGTVRKDGKDDDGAADVNLSFGDFKLGVHALELETGDPQGKVLDFYRKDMGRYGAVITCRGTETVGAPTRTAEGLDCRTDVNRTSDSGLQLRAGSPGHQHVVSLRGENGGTRISLVALELPGGSGRGGAGERE